jgi:hypothetical protein
MRTLRRYITRELRPLVISGLEPEISAGSAYRHQCCECQRSSRRVNYARGRHQPNGDARKPGGSDAGSVQIPGVIAIVCGNRFGLVAV